MFICVESAICWATTSRFLFVIIVTLATQNNPGTTFKWPYSQFQILCMERNTTVHHKPKIYTSTSPNTRWSNKSFQNGCKNNDPLRLLLLEILPVAFNLSNQQLHTQKGIKMVSQLVRCCFEQNKYGTKNWTYSWQINRKMNKIFFALSNTVKRNQNLLHYIFT